MKTIYSWTSAEELQLKPFTKKADKSVIFAQKLLVPVKVNSTITKECPSGVIKGNAGDYLTKNATDFNIVPAEKFEAEYEVSVEPVSDNNSELQDTEVMRVPVVFPVEGGMFMTWKIKEYNGKKYIDIPEDTSDNKIAHEGDTVITYKSGAVRIEPKV